MSQIEKYIIRLNSKPKFHEDTTSPDLHKGQEGLDFFSSILKSHETFGLIIRVYDYSGSSYNELRYAVGKTGLLYCWNGKNAGQWFKYKEALSETMAPSGWFIEDDDFGLLPHDYVRKHFDRKNTFQKDM